VGQGSTFWFTVVMDVLPVPSAEERELLATKFRGQRVLVVDDNTTNRQISSAYVRGWGFRCDDASSPVQALALMREAVARGDPYRVALLDYQMPDMDGLQLGRAIQRDPRLHGTRLILLTSVGNLEDPAVTQEAGFVARLMKPVKPTYLREVVLAALASRTAVSALPGEPRAPWPSAPAEARTEAPAAADGPRLLLAEDNAVNQKVAQLTLRRLGHRVGVVGSGGEVLEALERARYDLILMDCQMPGMDGYAATRAIRSRESGAQRIPIVAMTANAMPGDRERCLAAGMDDYITKPVRIEELSEVLRTWLPSGRVSG
jgi:CheY-like chemotaxis protein